MSVCPSNAILMDPFSVGELLVFNPMTSASASLMMMEISTTTHSISCKPVLPSIHMYTMTMTRKEAATTSEMMTMKATAMTTITLMNQHKGNKRLVVEGVVVLILIRKK